MLLLHIQNMCIYIIIYNYIYNNNIFCILYAATRKSFRNFNQFHSGESGGFYGTMGAITSCWASS